MRLFSALIWVGAALHLSMSVPVGLWAAASGLPTQLVREIDHDDFTPSRERPTDAILNDTLTEGNWSKWRASSSLRVVASEDGINGVVRPVANNHPAQASFPLDMDSSKGGLYRMSAQFDFGSTGGKGVYWAFGLARNVNNFQANGVLWAMVQPDGNWSLRQFHGEPLESGQLTLSSGVHQYSIDLDIERNRASFSVDGKVLARNIDIPDNADATKKWYALVLFQWLDERSSLGAVSVNEVR